jgi:uncharacterized protein YkwD
MVNLKNQKTSLLSFIVALFLLFCSFDSGNKYLDKIRLYQKDSYFKEQVYQDKDQKGFYAMKEPNQSIDPDNYDLHLLGAAVFFATNKLRVSKGLKPFKYSNQLRDAAVIHTSQMIEKNFFDHFNNFTPALRSPEQRMKICGVNADATAENVDYNHLLRSDHATYIQLAETIVDVLYHSPPHRKNLLNKIYTQCGCAAIFESKDKQGARYVKATQDFSSN